MCWSCSSGSAPDSKGVRFRAYASGAIRPTSSSFSRKLCEGFLVEKRLPCTHHYTYTADLHCATAFAHIALQLHRSPTLRHSICTHRPTLTPLTYTAPQHLHTSHHIHCTHHYTYTAHLRRATAFAHIAFTSPLIFSFFKAGAGLAGIVGAHPLRV